MLADPSVDAVDICLPTPEHRTATEAALAAGKHVLVEKPLALTLADADALVDAAERTDKIVMVAHVLRFWPEYVELQRLVASGELGRPLSAVATRRQPFPAWSELFARSDLTGGAVVDMMIHDYDALNWLFGTPQSVVCRGHKNARSGGWDQTQVLIDYGNASAVVDGGMTMPDSYPFSSSLQVLCERGAIEYHFRAGGRSVEMGAGVNDLILYPETGDPVRLDVPQADPYATECAYFIDCIQSRPARPTAPPRPTPAAPSRSRWRPASPSTPTRPPAPSQSHRPLRELHVRMRYQSISRSGHNGLSAVLSVWDPARRAMRRAYAKVGLTVRIVLITALITVVLGGACAGVVIYALDQNKIDGSGTIITEDREVANVRAIDMEGGNYRVIVTRGSQESLS